MVQVGGRQKELALKHEKKRAPRTTKELVGKRTDYLEQTDRRKVRSSASEPWSNLRNRSSMGGKLNSVNKD